MATLRVVENSAASFIKIKALNSLKKVLLSSIMYVKKYKPGTNTVVKLLQSSSRGMVGS